MPFGPTARVACWHETFRKYNLSLVCVSGKDNTIDDVLDGWFCPTGRALQDVPVHGQETEFARRLIAFKRQSEEGIIDPDFKCFVVQSMKAPTAHIIRSVAASISPIAHLSVLRVVPDFPADNDVLTLDWGPAYTKCPYFWWSL